MNETWYSFYAPNNKNLIQTSNKKWYKDNRIKSTRYYCVSDAWSKASELYNYLSGIYKSQTYKTSKSLQTDINNKSIKIGYVAFFKDKSGKVHHAVIIGKITSNDCFYYAHSTDRNAIKETNY